MATVESLTLRVSVDIKEAVASLEDLQEKLEDVADSIQQVDARGTKGIDVDTEVHGVDRELTQTAAKIEAAERAMSLDIPMDVHDRSVAEILARSGFSSTDALGGTFQDDMLAAFQRADLDFGAHSVPSPTGGVSGPIRHVDTSTGGRRGGILTRSLRRMSSVTSLVTDRLENFDLRMSDIHNMLARLVPILIVFIGTIPAVVTALVGLAAAAVAAAASLAAIAGFGALGVGLVGGQFDAQRLTDIWEDIRDSFIDAFAPLAERLQNTFLDAVDGLELLFQKIANEGDALVALTDEAKAFGGFVMDFVPGFLRTLAGLVEALSPIFANIGDFLDREFANIMRTLVELTAETVPVIADMALIIGRAVPAIVQMSIGFAQVAKYVMLAVGAFFEFLGVLGITPRLFGILTAATLAAATAFLLWNSSILAVASGALMRLGAMIIATIGRLTGYSMASVMATVASWGLYRALAALIGLTGIGLILVGLSTGASMVATEFSKASMSIDQTTQSLKDFDRVAGNVEGGFNPYGGDPPSSGGAAATGGNPSQTTINIESSGDKNEDRSNARYVSFRQGRTTGSNN